MDNYQAIPNGFPNTQARKKPQGPILGSSRARTLGSNNAPFAKSPNNTLTNNNSSPAIVNNNNSINNNSNNNNNSLSSPTQNNYGVLPQAKPTSFATRFKTAKPSGSPSARVKSVSGVSPSPGPPTDNYMAFPAVGKPSITRPSPMLPSEPVKTVPSESYMAFPSIKKTSTPSSPVGSPPINQNTHFQNEPPRQMQISNDSYMAFPSMKGPAVPRPTPFPNPVAPPMHSSPPRVASPAIDMNAVKQNYGVFLSPQSANPKAAPPSRKTYVELQKENVNAFYSSVPQLPEVPTHCSSCSGSTDLFCPECMREYCANCSHEIHTQQGFFHNPVSFGGLMPAISGHFLIPRDQAEQKVKEWGTLNCQSCFLIRNSSMHDSWALTLFEYHNLNLEHFRVLWKNAKWALWDEKNPNPVGFPTPELLFESLPRLHGAARLTPENSDTTLIERKKTSSYKLSKSTTHNFSPVNSANGASNQSQDLVLSSDGFVVSCSLSALVVFVTSAEVVEPVTASTLFSSYYSFCTAEELWMALKTRYTETLMLTTNTELAKITTNRVCNVLLEWAQKCSPDFSESLKGDMATFFETVVLKDHGEVTKKRLLESLVYRDFIQTQKKEPPKPKILKKPLNKVNEIDPLEFARQYSLIFSQAQANLRPSHFFQKNFLETRDLNCSEPIKSLIVLSNNLASQVSSVIVNETDLKKRVALIEFYISTAHHMRELHNFFGVSSILDGLLAVEDLKNTFSKISSKSKDSFQKLEQEFVLFPSKYLTLLKSSNGPRVPDLKYHLDQIWKLQDASPDIVNDTLINFEKRVEYSKIINQVLLHATTIYNFTPSNEIKDFLNSIPIFGPLEITDRVAKIEPMPSQKSNITFLEPDEVRKIKEAFHRCSENIQLMKKPPTLVPTLENCSARVSAIQEAIRLESYYCSFLDSTIRYYLRPLLRSANTKFQILTLPEIQTLFGTYERFYHKSKVFLEELRDKMKQFDPTYTEIGESFAKFACNLDLEIDYDSKFQDLTQTYVKIMKKNTKFEKLIEGNLQLPEFEEQSLYFLLSLPLTHLSSYNKTLKSIQKETPPSHSDYQCIEIAINLFAKPAIDWEQRSKRLWDSDQVISFIKECPSSTFDFFSPERRLRVNILCEVSRTKMRLVIFSDTTLLINQKKKATEFCEPNEEVMVIDHSKKDKVTLQAKKKKLELKIAPQNQQLILDFLKK